jgi:hypothetical protein
LKRSELLSTALQFRVSLNKRQNCFIGFFATPKLAGETAGLVMIAQAKQLFIRINVALRTKPYAQPNAPYFEKLEEE